MSRFEFKLFLKLHSLIHFIDKKEQSRKRSACTKASGLAHWQQILGVIPRYGPHHARIATRVVPDTSRPSGGFLRTHQRQKRLARSPGPETRHHGHNVLDPSRQECYARLLWRKWRSRENTRCTLSRTSVPHGS